MTREEVLASVRERVKNPNLINHMLATEAIMRVLARRLGEAEEEWGLAGLVHDIDVEVTQDDFSRHSQVGAQLAREMGGFEALLHAVLAHNEIHGVALESSLDKALYCADPLTGLIVAAALVRPDKKLSGLTLDSLVKRFGDKRFAAGARREQMERCRELGLELEEFLALGLEAMKEIAPALGL